jgi:hypothetical protein
LALSIYKNINCPISLLEVPDIVFHLVYVNKTALGVGVQAFFPDVIVVSFDSFYYYFDICYSQFFSISSLSF